MHLTFLHNMRPVELDVSDVHLTTLQWLRSAGFTGTKEGCAEGDCGACTCVVAEPNGAMVPINTCIQPLSNLHGRALFSVEWLAQDEWHPIQRALVEHHGSQCGFCTPGFVMTLWYALHQATPTDPQQSRDLLAGNLCRCTGYTGLLTVADQLDGLSIPSAEAEFKRQIQRALGQLDITPLAIQPTTLAQALRLRAQQPDAQVMAGNTDVGLWMTKRHDRFSGVLQLHQVAELKSISDQPDALMMGSMVTYQEALTALAFWPALGELIRRIGSVQVRSAGTIGGNIANGSPIGDMPPALIALDAQICLSSMRGERWIDLADFFIQYGQQDLAPDELLTWIRIPKTNRRLYSYKLSKRFDQDISAVSLAFSAHLDDDVIKDARLALGGMAGTPIRVREFESRIEGLGIDEALACVAELEGLVQPLSDMRASAQYRTRATVGLLRRALLAAQGRQPINLAALGVDDVR